MVESQDKKLTVVFTTFSNSLVVIDNTTESVRNGLNLRGATDSFAISSDNRFIYAAERSVVASGATLAGAVEIFDLNNVSAGSTQVSVPGAVSLALSHNGGTLLVFSDNSDDVSVINTGNTAAGTTPIHGFHRPIFAVFTSDDSTAYVLNCGAECGAGAAGVASVNVGAQTLTMTLPVDAARSALLDGTTLYVAGTVPGSPGSGKLTVVNTSSLSAMPSVAITDGIHDRMALGSNGKLFVGARACSNTTMTGGCLAIYDTASRAVVIHPPILGPAGTPLPGDITGIEPIPGRNVVYVCEGGELNIYDTTTSGLSKSASIDIVGKAADVKEVF
jgi:DNA-binding beta-propeller fold protein YncE